MRTRSRCPLLVALILGAMTLSAAPRTFAGADAGASHVTEPCYTSCISSECEGAGGACGQGSSYDCEHDTLVLNRCAERCKDQEPRDR